MKASRLVLTRTQILAFRRRVGSLEERLPAGARSLRHAAWAALWTSRVWPGAVLVAGEIVGTWRRANHEVSIDTWRRLSRPARDAVEAEAASLPLPDVTRPIVVRWS